MEWIPHHHTAQQNHRHTHKPTHLDLKEQNWWLMTCQMISSGAAISSSLTGCLLCGCGWGWDGCVEGRWCLDGEPLDGLMVVGYQGAGIRSTKSGARASAAARRFQKGFDSIDVLCALASVSSNPTSDEMGWMGFAWMASGGGRERVAEKGRRDGLGHMSDERCWILRCMLAID